MDTTRTDRGFTDGTLRRLIALGLTASALAFVGAGCGGDDGGDGGGATTDEPAATQTTPSDGGTTAGDATAGAEVFSTVCAVCHGDNGTGGSGPSLQDPQYADEQLVTDQVENGGGGMPAYGDQLSDQEVADVVAYVNEDLSQR